MRLSCSGVYDEQEKLRERERQSERENDSPKVAMTAGDQRRVPKVKGKSHYDNAIYNSSNEQSRLRSSIYLFNIQYHVRPRGRQSLFI